MSKPDIKCAECGSELPADVDSCSECGELIMSICEDGDDSVQESEQKPITVYVEPPMAFASGLPEWTIEPPAAVVIRRKPRI